MVTRFAPRKNLVSIQLNGNQKWTELGNFVNCIKSVLSQGRQNQVLSKSSKGMRGP